MITIQIGEEKDRINRWAEFGAYRASEATDDAAQTLAKRLVDHGHDPTEPVQVCRGEMVCLTYPTLAALAGKRIRV